jgi:hypothetical protein
MVLCWATQTRQARRGMIQTSKRPTKDQIMSMNRTTSPADVTELTIDQLSDVNGGLNALTVVAAIGLDLALSVARGGLLAAEGAAKVGAALK